LFSSAFQLKVHFVGDLRCPSASKYFTFCLNVCQPVKKVLVTMKIKKCT
jgi:hypothetical protein